ncbi:MAG: polysaccharide biosynthesis C-terminal domain-containing protein [Cyclobacteriaceae bacterium]|nr:polysaccharide biosynthesis C-terminal domain-containing protein [Cyclobacteriaceae bacterium]
MSSLRKLAGDTMLYGLSSIIGRTLNYLLFPLHTAVFSSGNYGIITELYAFAAFLNVVYVYGLETAYFRFASKYKEDEPIVYSTAVWSIIITSITFTFLLFIFSEDIVNWMGYEGQAYFIQWFALILAIDAILAIPFANLRYREKALFFASAKLINIGINVAINVFFLFFCYKIYNQGWLPDLLPFVKSVYNPELGVEYVFLANLIANGSLMFILFSQFKRLSFRINWDYLVKMLKYGYPILFTGLALVTNEMLSRSALKYWLPEGFYPDFTNQEILGIFGGVFKLSVFMTLGIQAFRYAAEPFFFKKSEQKNSPELFSNVMTWFVIFGCFVYFSISLNLDILQFLLRREEYRTAMHIVPILLLGGLFMGINYNLSVWYKLTDKTSYGMWITIFGAILTVFLNFILIPIYGYTGSAFVSLIAYFLMSAFSYILGKKHYPIPYKTLKLLAYILITFLVVNLLSMVKINNLVLSFIFHLICILIFILTIYWIERKNIARFSQHSE